MQYYGIIISYCRYKKRSNIYSTAAIGDNMSQWHSFVLAIFNTSRCLRPTALMQVISLQIQAFILAHLKTSRRPFFEAQAYVHYLMKILIRTNNVSTSRSLLLATSTMMGFDRIFLISAPVLVSSTLHRCLRNATF
jgi:hypothetical protein